ncbi:hypothetical protein NC651_001113 [Populus alba x Populus x berolinensis]|nr:hypothetical protein NC651_001113 [Populus alba x Populus x berolinensis]
MHVDKQDCTIKQRKTSGPAFSQSLASEDKVIVLLLPKLRKKMKVRKTTKSKNFKTCSRTNLKQNQSRLRRHLVATNRACIVIH